LKRLGWLGAVAMVAAVALTGCGGGGGGSTPPPSGRSVSVFATDDMNTGFSQVWIKVYKVEVTNATGSSLGVVFDDPNGRVINVRALRDNNGARFAFLGVGSLPQNASGVTITVDPQVTATGPFGIATVPFVNTVPRDPQGRPLLKLNIEGSGASGALVVDFDLSKWSTVGQDPPTAIDPTTSGVHVGNGNGLGDMTRHEREDYEGTVSQLSGTAPSLTFTLTMEHGSVTVTTDANTAVYNSDNTPNPQIANGEMVTVRGVFNVTTSTLAAAEVKIHRGSMANEHGVAGVTDAPNAARGTFTIMPHDADFLPNADYGGMVSVVTDANTVFRAESGLVLTSAQFFARLAEGSQKVEAEGTFDAGRGVLSARLVKIEQIENHGGGGGGGDHSHDAEAKGTAVNANAANGTFTINPMTEWEGFMGMGGSVNVATNSSTVFKNLSDQTISAADFFAAIAGGTSHVQVEGSFSAGVITATKVELKP